MCFFVGTPTCIKPVIHPPRLLHVKPLLTLYHIFFKGVIRNIGIETGARNQTVFVFQSLISDTFLFPRPTVREILKDLN